MPRLVSIAASAAFLVVFALPAAVAGGQGKEIIEQILVKVNGEILTKSDLELRQIQAIRQSGTLDPVSASEAELRRAIAEVTPRLLAEAVDEMLLLQRGRELGQAMSDAQFQGIMDNLKKENPSLETDAQFEAALQQEGMTMGDLRRMFERQMITNRVQQLEILPKITVTEEEARSYFQTNPDQFRAEPGITLREMLIRVPEDPDGINVGQDDAAREKAEALLARARKGEAFEDLVAESSEAGSRSNGGLVGPVKSEELAEELLRLIDPLKPGEISSIVRSRQGFQFFKLESRTTTDRLTFEQVRTQISDRLADDKRLGELVKYLETLRAQAIIEWLNPELEQAYEQGLTIRANELGTTDAEGATN